MSRFYVEVHPGYGAVPLDGEYVVPGDVLGLSTDARHVVKAPVGGRVRVSTVNGTAGRSVRLRIVAEDRSLQHSASP